MRIAVTRECNYRCFFCHIEGDPVGRPQQVGTSPPAVLPSDYYVIARAARELGVSSFKLTGGEPLVRHDIVEVVKSIREGAGENSDISMTTNGYLLAMMVKRLREAGLRRVNISIHSLDRHRYEMITGVDGLPHALEGLRKAIEAGLEVKVNMTVTKDNMDDVWKLIDLAGREGFKVQLIELQPVNRGKDRFREEHVALNYIEERLKSMAVSTRHRSLHNRPIYVLADGVEVEVVKPFDNPLFCAGCTRIRLLADGRLTPCINYVGPGVNLLSRIRGLPLERAVERAKEAIQEVNRLRRPFYMWTIGLRSDGGKGLGGPIARLTLPKRSPRRSLAAPSPAPRLVQ